MQAYFVLWSVERNEILWRVKCGGAHRVWDLALKESVSNRTLPWKQNFWITTIGSLSNDDGDGNENGKKAKRLISKRTLHVHHVFFVHFSAVVARVRHELFTRPLYGVGEHTENFSFSFSKLRYSPFGFNHRKFRQI